MPRSRRSRSSLQIEGRSRDLITAVFRKPPVPVQVQQTAATLHQTEMVEHNGSQLLRPGNAVGDNDQSPGHIAGFLLILVQLGLIAGIVRLFAIESARHFLPVLCAMIGGFVVHVWLPPWLRLRFFAVLSMACIPFALGFIHGMTLLAIGGVLIGICFIPVTFRVRLFVLVSASAVLVCLRTQWPHPIWPVLGSMFMFRLIIYVYSSRKTVEKIGWAESVSYFFMLPNICFPLFPVVDFRTFRKTRTSTNDWALYQRGITWMVRGLVHLLLYRYINSHLVPRPYELYDVPHIAVFAVTNYALYLHVSGQFHLITGLLHLFGFGLPRTHHHFFLASSFTDIWRRINIYWKDFMSRLFFFPTFYAVRRRGASVAVATVTAVFCVFACTWLLHSWQMYWLLGSFPLTANDAGLWLGAGVCVAINALLDARRRLHAERSAWLVALIRAARTVAMFTLISLFWACWTEPNFPALVRGAIDRPGAITGLLVVLLWMTSTVVALTFAMILYQHRTAFRRPATVSFRDKAALHAVALGLVLTVASPGFSTLLGPKFQVAVNDLCTGSESRDALDRLGGYYEDLNAAAVQSGPLITAISPHSESLRSQAEGFAKVSRRADVYQEVELIPGVNTELSGSQTSINLFGMRDRNLTLHKPPGTIRVACVGSSVVMGYGVHDHEVFTRLLEKRLNAEVPNGTNRYEVLNFGVGRQWASHRLVRIQRQVLGFDPDAVYYFAHQDEYQFFAAHLGGLVADGLTLPTPHLTTTIEELGVTQDMAPGEISSRLQRNEDELLGAVYRSIVNECQDIVAVWIYLPIPTDTASPMRDRLLPIARNAGFIICDLSAWATGRPVADVLPAADDPHTLAQGHQLITEALLQELKSQPDALPLTATDDSAWIRGVQ